MKFTDTNGYIFAQTEQTRFSCIGRSDEKFVVMDEKTRITGRFPAKCTGNLFFRLKDGVHDTITVRYGPTKDSLFFSLAYQVTEDGFVIIPDFVAIRFFEISVSNHKVPVRKVSLKLFEFGIISTACPYLSKGKFLSDNRLLNQIWDAGAYTLKLCTQKIEHSRCGSQGYVSRISPYMVFDGPRRDREVWTGDIRCEALIAYSAFGDALPIKSSLQYIADLQLSDGQMPASGCTKQAFLTYNLWWIISVYEYCLYTADIQFLHSVYAALRSLEEYLMYHTDENGELRNSNYTSTWMWTFPRGEYCCTVQMIYYKALQCLYDLECLMGEKERAIGFLDRREKLKKRIMSVYWNEERGVFEDELYCDCEQQPILTDVNCFAICFGVADGNRAERSLRFLEEHMHTPFGSTTTDISVIDARPKPGKNGVIGTISNRSADPVGTLNRFMWGHNRKIWPFIVGYEAEARFRAGDDRGAVNLIEACWGNMIRRGMDTFWEMSDIDGCFCTKSMNEEDIGDNMNSAAHGWSGWVTYLLSCYVAGVRPLTYGFSEFLFPPSWEGPHLLKADVPAPSGKIKVEIDRGNKSIRLEYPKDLTPVIHIEKFVGYRLEKIPYGTKQNKGGKQ